MEEPKEEDLPLVVEREAEMASSPDAAAPIKRKAWFLDPTPVAPADEVPRSPLAPSTPRNVSLLRLRDSKVLFRGWAAPLRKWGDWVDKLRPVYGDLWKRSGISDAIAVSTYKIKKDYASLLGLAVFWCGETNTFVLPWGEATVTLEDMIVLGGFPVLGEPVRGSLAGELAEIEQRMIREHRTFNRSTSKKADQSAWMRHFVEGEGDELEHVAFLALWLSRFVFPGPPIKTVKQHMLPIAVRLARGMKIALGPAVLASLYRDLGVIKDYLLADSSHKTEPLIVWAPFNMLQLWVWEHFLAFRPEKQNLIAKGEPRAARWHDVVRKSDIYLVSSAFDSSKFHWRPYTVSLENWSMPSFYRDDGVWIRGDAAKNEEVRELAQCLRAAELVGVDCIEPYLPHRVSMQFGLDQDMPCHIPRSNSTWEVAWETYDITSKSISFYIPPQFFKSDITLQYSIWWKQHNPSFNVFEENFIEQQVALENANKSQSTLVLENKTKKVNNLPSTKKRKLQEFYDPMLSDCLVSGSNSVSGENDTIESDDFQPSSTKTDSFHSFAMKQKEYEEVRPSSDCFHKSRHNQDVSQSVKLGIYEITALTSDNEDKVMIGDFNRRNGLRSYADFVVPRQLGVNVASQEAKLKLEQELEKRIMMKAEESALEMQIKALKAEIAVIEARAMELESVAEVLTFFLVGYLPYCHENPPLYLSLKPDAFKLCSCPSSAPTASHPITLAEPIILVCQADSTLAPKLCYLFSLFPPFHLSNLFVANPTLLSRSLKAHIVPLFDLLRCFLDSPNALLQVTHRNRHILTCNLVDTVTPNIALLDSRGVPAENITKLLATHLRPAAIFVEAVEIVSELGFDPNISLFIHAIRATNCMLPSTLEAKIEFFRRLGWPEEEFRFAFQRAPLFVLVPNYKLQKMVEFWMKEVKTSVLSRQRKLLMYSLENRLLPRFRVYRLLEAEEVLKQRSERMRIRMVTGMFTCSEEVFMDRYALRYGEIMPDLTSVYHPQVVLALVSDSAEKN